MKFGHIRLQSRLCKLFLFLCFHSGSLQHTQTQTDTHRHTHRDAQTETERHTHTHTHTHRDTHRQTDRQTDTHTHRDTHLYNTHITYFMTHSFYACLVPPSVVGVLLTCQSLDQGWATSVLESLARTLIKHT